MTEIVTSRFPTDDPKCVYFEFGAPGPELFSLDLLKNATLDLEKFYGKHAWTVLQYGPSLGSAYFRTNVNFTEPSNQQACGISFQRVRGPGESRCIMHYEWCFPVFLQVT